LCQGCPFEFREFVRYSKGLRFDEEPKYDYLKGLIMKVSDREGYDMDDKVFDWEDGDFKIICDY
jgi:hypothetical protein